MRAPRASGTKRGRGGGWLAGPTGSGTRREGAWLVARLGFKACRPSVASGGGTRGHRLRQPAATDGKRRRATAPPLAAAPQRHGTTTRRRRASGERR
uniref:Uncharacterized protein n=1 Tax=Oryza sativa subsp. japonica TaxID=39947 RepID=Q84Z67_ORYSJ|nr:hypothetical protein [Oryza sativa Japonica Group]